MTSPRPFSSWDQDALREAMQAMPPARPQPNLPGSASALGNEARMAQANEHRARLMAMLAPGDELTTAEVADALGLSPSAAAGYLRAVPGVVRRRADRVAYWSLP